MATSKVINDASRSSQGTIYQTYIALKKCFEMGKGQCVIIEKLGDVTVPGDSQLEIKAFDAANALTDSHINFWKSVKNWTDPSSDIDQYHALVLHTTQPFGARTSLKPWNESTVDQRVAILEAIHQSSEQRFQADPDPKKEPTEALKCQRAAMDMAQRNKLREVAERVVIADESPDLAGVFRNLCDQYCVNLPESNREQYLGALLGLVLRPETIENSWTVTKDEFESLAQQLAPKFVLGTKRFPIRYRHPIQAPLTSEHETLKNSLFVDKILAINYGEKVQQALKDYLFVQKTLLEEFGQYSAEKEDYETFADEVENLFKAAHSMALKKVSDLIGDSQYFFDERHYEQAPHFPGREQPPREFRNGVIHMHLNDGAKRLRWLLETES